MKVFLYSLLLLLLWIPRILCILFGVFISFFALDVFGNNAGFWKTFLDLVMHLIPTFLIIIILILSWKWPWIGGISLILLGIAYIMWSLQSGRGSYIIYMPLFLTGIFYLVSWFLRKEIKQAQTIYRGDDI
jgi:hypothetical protein